MRQQRCCGSSFYLWGFVDGSNLCADPQRDVLVLCVPAVQIPEMLVSRLPPEVEEAICNCVVLKHDVVNMPVFLFDKVQASGHPQHGLVTLPITNTFPGYTHHHITAESPKTGTQKLLPSSLPSAAASARHRSRPRRTHHGLEHGEVLNTPSTPLTWVPTAPTPRAFAAKKRH